MEIIARNNTPSIKLIKYTLSFMPYERIIKIKIISMTLSTCHIL